MSEKSELHDSGERLDAPGITAKPHLEEYVGRFAAGTYARLKAASEVSADLEFDSGKILEKVRDTLVDALGIDDDEVTFEALLEKDLGAESIDFLDIVFRLEKNFGIKISRGELFPEFKIDRSESHRNDEVPSEVFEQLDNGFNHIDRAAVEALRKSPTVGNIGIIFTVKSLVDFIQQKISLDPQPWHFEFGYCKQKGN